MLHPATSSREMWNLNENLPPPGQLPPSMLGNVRAIRTGNQPWTVPVEQRHHARHQKLHRRSDLCSRSDPVWNRSGQVSAPSRPSLDSWTPSSASESLDLTPGSSSETTPKSQGLTPSYRSLLELQPAMSRSPSEPPPGQRSRELTRREHLGGRGGRINIIPLRHSGKNQLERDEASRPHQWSPLEPLSPCEGCYFFRTPHQMDQSKDKNTRRELLPLETHPRRITPNADDQLPLIRDMLPYSYNIRGKMAPAA